MKTNTALRIPSEELDSIINGLDVNFVALSKCNVSDGYSLQLGNVDAPGIHYTMSGKGRVIINGIPPIPIAPHTLIVVPPNKAIRIEVDKTSIFQDLKRVNSADQNKSQEDVRLFRAGNTIDEDEVVMICGFFKATYGLALNPFSLLTIPVVEQFDVSNRLDLKLTSALDELEARQFGSKTMSAALLKEIIILLLRQSLSNGNEWIKQFSLFSNPQIARAFAAMLANPELPHSILTLADIACLSRSTFMAQFTKLFEDSPMVILKHIRMRRAIQLLKQNNYTVEQIAFSVGYKNRSSFIRAFQKLYGVEPSNFRQSILSELSQNVVVG